MHHKTQTSIVVKAEDGQEYICCEEGTEENAINWDDAIAATEQDDFGFIEFSGLKFMVNLDYLFRSSYMSV